MATTGEKYPAAAASVSEAPWSSNPWSNVADVGADDGDPASITSPQFDTNDRSYVLKAYTFDFSSLSDSATILGVICRVNAWYANGTVELDLMQLLDTGGAKGGTNQCGTPVALTTDDTTVITKGSPTDLWELSLTPAWLKDSDFGVALGCIATGDNADVFVDYVTLEVYFSLPPVQVTPGPAIAAASCIDPQVAIIDGTLINMQVAANADDWQIDYPTAWTFYQSGQSPGWARIGEFGAGYHAWGAFRFALGQAIPDGATITSAYLSLYSYDVGAGWGESDFLRLFVTDGSDPPAGADASDRPAIDSGDQTTYPTSFDSGVRWPASGGLTWPASGWVQSTDIKSLIQYLVDTYSGLSSGAHIVVWTAAPADVSPNIVKAYDYYGSTAYAAKLAVVYKEISGVQVTPAAVIANASLISPTVVLGSTSATPGNAEADVSAESPVVVLGSINITPALAEARTSALNPSVIKGSISLTPGLAEAGAAVLDPAVVLGSTSLTPALVNALAACVDPSVQAGGGVEVTPAFAEALASCLDPTVVLGSINVTPAIAEVLAACEDPAVVLGSVELAPSIVEAQASAEEPAVVLGSVSLTPALAQALASAVDPMVTTGTLYVTPATAEALAAALAPSVVLGSVTIGPAVIEALALALDPNVIVTGEMPARLRAINLFWTFGAGMKR